MCQYLSDEYLLISFSISAEIVHHYVPYMELVQNYFLQTIRQKTQIWIKMPGQADPQRGTFVYEFTTLFFIEQIWLELTAMLLLKEWGKKNMFRHIYTLLWQDFKPIFFKFS